MLRRARALSAAGGREQVVEERPKASERRTNRGMDAQEALGVLADAERIELEDVGVSEEVPELPKLVQIGNGTNSARGRPFSVRHRASSSSTSRDRASRASRSRSSSRRRRARRVTTAGSGATDEHPFRQDARTERLRQRREVEDLDFDPRRVGHAALDDQGRLRAQVAHDDVDVASTSEAPPRRDFR